MALPDGAERRARRSRLLPPRQVGRARRALRRVPARARRSRRSARAPPIAACTGGSSDESVATKPSSSTSPRDVVDLHVDTFIWTRIFGYDLLRRHGRGLLGARFYGQADLPRLREARRRRRHLVDHDQPDAPRLAPHRRLSQEPRSPAWRSSPPRPTRSRSAAPPPTTAPRAPPAATPPSSASRAATRSTAISRSRRFDASLLIKVTLVHLSTSSARHHQRAARSPATATARSPTAAASSCARSTAHRIFVDLAHINRRGFFDAVAVHDKSQPLLVSHTGIAGVHQHWRNVDDEQLRAVADTGGVVGVMYQSSFLGEPLLGGGRAECGRRSPGSTSSTPSARTTPRSAATGTAPSSRRATWPTCLELPRLCELMLAARLDARAHPQDPRRQLPARAGGAAAVRPLRRSCCSRSPAAPPATTPRSPCRSRAPRSTTRRFPRTICAAPTAPSTSRASPTPTASTSSTSCWRSSRATRAASRSPAASTSAPRRRSIPPRCPTSPAASPTAPASSSSALDAGAPDYLRSGRSTSPSLADGGPFGDREPARARAACRASRCARTTRYAAVVTRAVRDTHGRRLRAAGAVAAAARRLPGRARRRSRRSSPAADVAALAVFTTDDPTAQVGRRARRRASPPIRSRCRRRRRRSSPPSTTTASSARTIDVPDYQSGSAALPDGRRRLALRRRRPSALRPHGGRAHRLHHPARAHARRRLAHRRVRAHRRRRRRPLVDRGPATDRRSTSPSSPAAARRCTSRASASPACRSTARSAACATPPTATRSSSSSTCSTRGAARQRAPVGDGAVAGGARAARARLRRVTPAPAPAPRRPRSTPAHLALMGHSMGSWIAPLALAFEPRYGAAVLSGAGGSYIANVMDKIKPLHVRPLAEILLDYNMDQRSLDAHDPGAHARAVGGRAVRSAGLRSPHRARARRRRIAAQRAHAAGHRRPLHPAEHRQRHQPGARARRRRPALRRDERRGAVADAGAARARSCRSPACTPIALPAAGNAGASTTALVVQHPGDAIEDGHEVVFQTDPPKHQYRCFLQSFARGAAPTVPPDGAADDPCP